MDTFFYEWRMEASTNVKHGDATYLSLFSHFVASSASKRSLGESSSPGEVQFNILNIPNTLSLVPKKSWARVVYEKSWYRGTSAPK